MNQTSCGLPLATREYIPSRHQATWQSLLTQSHQCLSKYLLSSNSNRDISHGMNCEPTNFICQNSMIGFIWPQSKNCLKLGQSLATVPNLRWEKSGICGNRTQPLCSERSQMLSARTENHCLPLSWNSSKLTLPGKQVSKTKSLHY